MRSAPCQPPPRKRGSTLLPRRSSSPGIRLLLACLLLWVLTPARAASHPPAFQLPAGEFDPWIPHGPERAWSGLCSSADGRLLAATALGDRVHISNDFGETWIPRGPVQAWQAIASSADGNRLVAVVGGGRIHTSSDGGNTWHERATPRKWSAVASSADGLWLAATVNGGQVHTSTNGGVNWTEGGSIQAWTAIASSADGRKLAATAYDAPIFASTDGGLTWEARGPVRLWKAITSSADGSRLAAAVWEGRISTSTNSALTWTEWDSNPYGLGGRLHRWRAIASTSDGSMCAAVDVLLPEGWAGRGRVSVSADFGPSWEEFGRRLDWSAIACSADGLRWVAAAEGNRIHTQLRTTSRHTVNAVTNSGPVLVRPFATDIVATPTKAAPQADRFLCTADDPTLFVDLPSISPDGTLRFTPGARPGRTRVTVVAHEKGGAAEGGQNARGAQTFSIQVQSRAFVASAWTNDATAGVSRSSTLWGYRLAPATNPPALIQGVSLPAIGGVQPGVPGRFAMTGLENADTHFTLLTALGGEGSARLAGSYVNGFYGTQLRLEGLTPGVPYTVHLFSSPAPDRGPQLAAWSAESGTTEIDGAQFGPDWGIRVSHTFVPPEPTYRITISPLGEPRWNWHGLALNSTPAVAAFEQPGATPMASGASRDFGTLPLGTDTNLVFTVRNRGIVPLKEFNFTRSGQHPDDFDVIQAPQEPIPGSGGSTTFSVEFAPTALGRRSAALRIESNDSQPFVLQLTGTGLPENATVVHDIPDQVIDEDGSTGALPFEIPEAEPGSSPVIVAKSSEPSLVPNASIVIEGTGSRRQVTVTPAPDRSGSALIRIRVRNIRREICHVFRVTVNPVNDPPRFRIPAGTPIPVGTEWVQRASKRDWRAIAASRDGQRLAAIVHAGRIQVSTDTGANWSQRGEERAWTSVASSADGMRLVATVGGGWIYASPDGGSTWQPTASQRDWVAVAASGDGTRFAAAVDGGQIYTSTDAGASWTARERNREWRALAASADGDHLVAAVRGGHLFVSTDGGGTWTARAEAHAWTGVAISADGGRLAATAEDGPVFVSLDSGVTWEPRGEDRFWHAIACSADGRLLVASETLGRVWISEDFGASWAAGGQARDGGGLAMSGDGRVLASPFRAGPIAISEARIEPYTLAVGASSGLSVTTGFVTELAPGPGDEAGQSVSLVVTNDHPSLFLAPPAVDAEGALSFTPAGQPGAALITLIARDDGGSGRGGRDTSQPQVFRLLVRGDGFSYGPWTDDASTGINRATTLWAYRFGKASTNEITIRGFPVPLLSGPRLHVRGQFALLDHGPANPDKNAISPVRSGASLAGGYVSGGRPTLLALEGLVPGTSYTLLCFAVGFRESVPRTVTWQSGNDVAVIDADTYGAAKGIRVAYSFTAETTQRALVISPTRNDGTWPFYGLALNANPAGPGPRAAPELPGKPLPR